MVIVRVIPGGMAVVEFEQLADAETLVDMDGDEFCGSIIRTKFDGAKYTDAQRVTGRAAPKKVSEPVQWEEEEVPEEEEPEPQAKKPKHNPNKVVFD